jgi:hypothetical protein
MNGLLCGSVDMVYLDAVVITMGCCKVHRELRLLRGRDSGKFKVIDKSLLVWMGTSVRVHQCLIACCILRSTLAACVKSCSIR